MNNKKAGLRASITVEAAILLPFFIIAIMSFVFLIKVYYTNEIIQHAISGACEEMSVYSLLYYETNAEEVIGGIEKFSNSDTVREVIGENQLTSYIQQLGKEATDYIRANVALVPLARILVKKKLELSYSGSVDERLKGLNLENGFDSIDFSDSKMLADGKSIDITASYEIKFPFLSDLLPSIRINQNASACIWAGEDGVFSDETDDEQVQSIWDMPNIKRGREIRKLQGANLPFNFPTVAKFQNGTVSSIKSLNIDEEYYQSSKNLKMKISGYINKLEEFNGGKAGDTNISSSEIFRKELLLIIPETQLTSTQQNTIDECIQTARSKGINLKIVKAYGRKGNPDSNAVSNGDDNEDDPGN